MDYTWFLNFDNPREQHILKCLEYTKIRYKILDTALDINAEIIPNAKSLFIAIEDNTPEKRNAYYDISLRLSREFQRFLVREGIVTYEETLGKEIYLGCEKEYGWTIKK